MKITSGEILYNGKSITDIKESERQSLRRDEFGPMAAQPDNAAKAKRADAAL